ncbi:hypothetical protein M9434_003150 [Picochlorum sp. BPE23]|nr:hypothetical protein M9434_003150 [Picochlorum sp. BPE23]KAI8105188.1 hypothetical protein M9435_000358 [Picochlorum sp. BPE23]|mmetsp:Transcript_5436/g.10687  ORF Transcript_5436/g.10687 Transcript_5436/m.10687 type:complete len:311 (+) Transcript_5436:140-1072(+)
MNGHLDGLFAKAQEALRKLLAAVVCYKTTPRHIGFIMDGNRRYAQKLGIRTSLGHSAGYEVLLDCLQWCLELNVSVVSVYAFSIDNYKRSEEEVDTLMDLGESKLLELCRESETLRERGIRVQVLGDVSLAPKRVQEAAERVAEATRDNDRCTLNICFSYTSSEEMMHASGLAATDNMRGVCSHMDEYLYTAGCPPIDLLIRTSGETRLSDFMMRQSKCCLLHFSPKLWPEFSFIDLLQGILRYQDCYCELEEARMCVDQAKGRAMLYQHHMHEEHAHSGKDASSPYSIITPEDTSSVESWGEEGIRDAS